MSQGGSGCRRDLRREYITTQAFVCIDPVSVPFSSTQKIFIVKRSIPFFLLCGILICGVFSFSFIVFSIVFIFTVRIRCIYISCHLERFVLLGIPTYKGTLFSLVDRTIKERPDSQLHHHSFLVERYSELNSSEKTPFCLHLLFATLA